MTFCFRPAGSLEGTPELRLAAESYARTADGSRWAVSGIESRRLDNPNPQFQTGDESIKNRHRARYDRVCDQRTNPRMVRKTDREITEFSLPRRVPAENSVGRCTVRSPPRNTGSGAE